MAVRRGAEPSLAQIVSGRKQNKSRWLQRHRSDAFVKRARQQGYRSRAVYKLQEIDQRDGLLSRGMTVLELGAAPGGWAQYVADKVGSAGKVIAVDVLPMKPVANVRFLQGDLAEQAVQLRLIEILDGPVDLVLSDMAPNITGIKEVDRARYMELLGLTLDLSRRVLRRGGNALIKVFEGGGIKEFRGHCEQFFKRVAVRKPSASRPQSREYYLLATGLRKGHTTS